ncbi:hypothetical protein D3C72_1994240 [compost metagenome]
MASAPGLDAKGLLDIVDAEVYRAKRDGKNRIYLGGDAPLAQQEVPPEDDGILSKEEA